MLTKEQVLNIVKAKGPLIPNQIKKELREDTYIISALLSELSTNGLIKISNTKIGSSPTYYAPGQEPKLLELKKYLNEKDQRTLELLKETKVLRDKDQDLLIRVSLRNIKDFAKSIEVNVKGEKEIFWKWYLTPRSEAEEIIKKFFTSTTQTTKTEKEQKKELKEKEERKEEKQTEEKNKTIQQTPEEEKYSETINNNPFMKKIRDFFNQKNIEIIKEETIRKDSEIEFQIFIPSSVGKVEYFCKAKNKKRCNDGDLSSAYLKGQMKKIPVIFITTGEVTKKARNMLENEFKGMVLKKI